MPQPLKIASRLALGLETVERPRNVLENDRARVEEAAAELLSGVSGWSFNRIRKPVVETALFRDALEIQCQHVYQAASIAARVWHRETCVRYHRPSGRDQPSASMSRSFRDEHARIQRLRSSRRALPISASGSSFAASI